MEVYGVQKRSLSRKQIVIKLEKKNVEWRLTFLSQDCFIFFLTHFSGKVMPFVSVYLYNELGIFILASCFRISVAQMLQNQIEFALEPTDASDMDRIFTLPQTTFIGGQETALPLREIIRRLEVLTWCRNFRILIRRGSHPANPWWLLGLFTFTVISKMNAQNQNKDVCQVLTMAR